MAFYRLTSEEIKRLALIVVEKCQERSSAKTIAALVFKQYQEGLAELNAENDKLPNPNQERSLTGFDF